jgi:hypothetical protein
MYQVPRLMFQPIFLHLLPLLFLLLLLLLLLLLRWHNSPTRSFALLIDYHMQLCFLPYLSSF